ncbi:hypothetical protein [Methylobacterium oxalidis]
MNEYFIFAFIVMPIVIVCLGWGAALLHERDGRRRREAPGE